MSVRDTLHRALDRRGRPLTFFVRDDDAGWAHERLSALLTCWRAVQAPIDLAVIPAALTPSRAADLLAWRRAQESRLGLHQHGWSHRSHEGVHRRCEFGSRRTPAAVLADVRTGHDRLRHAFGEALDPVFTPPWNRCSHDTGLALRACGIQVLSREARAVPLAIDGLAECPVSIDWCARSRGVGLSRAHRVERAAEALATASTTAGLMLHHAAMDDEDVQAAADVVAAISAHPAVRCVSLLEAARTAVPAPHPALSPT
ncbi:MAG: polysaccharide deacetylase family protein [Acidobacteria bacterium]|nr:polysaccharide deacetylase family protein [Acidobacteriota bacterium]